jgi:hypothetical protein
MCKEIPVIQVNRVVDPKKNNKKMEGLGGGETQKNKTTRFRVSTLAYTVLITRPYYVHNLNFRHFSKVKRSKESLFLFPYISSSDLWSSKI